MLGELHWHPYILNKSIHKFFWINLHQKIYYIKQLSQYEIIQILVCKSRMLLIQVIDMLFNSFFWRLICIIKCFRIWRNRWELRIFFCFFSQSFRQISWSGYIIMNVFFTLTTFESIFILIKSVNFVDFFLDITIFAKDQPNDLENLDILDYYCWDMGHPLVI
jgi:hypothetical protein